MSSYILLSVFRETCKSKPETREIQMPRVRVVTRYMGSGIKGLKKGGIRDHSLGSGIKTLGIGISVFSMGSRIRRLDFVGSGIKIFITFGIRD